MTDVYKRLAEKVDGLPNSFPSTKSGIELKILRRIFTPEEAEMALQISPMPETVEAMAERLGKSVDEMQAILDTMVGKGQIGSFKQGGQRYYVFIPFVIGFVEASQLNRMTPEFAKEFEQYVPDLVKGYGGIAPAEARVVPVSTEIDQDLHVHRYEDMRQMIEEAKSFDLNECWCRQEAEADGRPCKHTKEICLSFSSEEDAFDKYRTGRAISKEEALAVMEQAEKEGLVHLTYNIEDGQVFVCNCCPCCCGLMRGLIDYNAPHIVAKSNFTASIDQDSCSACGVCADERCPTGAIVEDDGEFSVLTERCIGCGVCAPTCPTESITLVRRPESEQNKPAVGLVELHMERAANRGIEIEAG